MSREPVEQSNLKRHPLEMGNSEIKALVTNLAIKKAGVCLYPKSGIQYLVVALLRGTQQTPERSD